MARLPTPGSDDGSWGDILNDYLSQSHQTDGTLKPNVVTANQLAPSSITSASLAPNSVTSIAIADGAILNSKLDTPTKASIAKADSAVQGTDPRLTDARTPTAHTHTASAISDSTTVGRSLITATDVAAAQNVLELSSTFGRTGGAEAFVAKNDMRVSSIVIANAGDSTLDETQEWFWRGIAMWAALYPELAVSGYYGFGDSGPYTGPITIQAGTGGEWTAHYDDTFARMGDVYGSAPDIGNVYGGGASAFTANGTQAVSSGNGNSITQDAGSATAGGRRRVVLDTTMDTTPPSGVSRVLSLFMGQNSSNRVQARLSISTGGVQLLELIKIVGGASTTLASGTPNLMPSAVNTFDFSIEFNGTTGVTATVGGVSVSGTLAGGDVAAVVDAAYRLYIIPGSTSDSANIKINRARSEKWGATGRTCTLYNGARAGSIASYAVDRLTSLYPTTPDVLFISHGHNYGSGSVSAFLTAIDALCVTYRTVFPDSGIVLCSQNPEYTPAANISAHRDRQAALRRYAATKGYGYLPVYETYAAQSDQGASWVQSDGVHPKTASHAADPSNGSYRIAVLLKNYLSGLGNR